MANKNLTNAKKAKNDEFYTQYKDIEKEIGAYLDFDKNTFKDKVVYCNCDDPYESNFFKYFASKFKTFGLKKLVTTSYVGSPIVQTQMHFPGENVKELPDRKNRKAFKIEINDVNDLNKDGVVNLADVKKLLEHDKNASSPLHGDSEFAAGDFRSKECVALLEQADIVVTNPPFSLYRKFIEQLVQHNKKFVIIGSKNTITYKEIFPLIKDNKMWVGTTSFSKDMLFIAPANADLSSKPKTAIRIVDGITYLRSPSVWFSNLDHGRRHQSLPLMTMEENLKYSKHKEIKGKKAYDKYDNSDAIDVPFTDSIPSDYDGVMGVPITFLDKYNPEQFEIIKFRHGDDNKDLRLKDGTCPFFRILIKHKKK